MAVERGVTGSWCDLEWSGVSVWSVALSVWLCKMWWDGVTLAGCCSGLPAPEGLLPVLHENVQQCLVMLSSLCIHKKTHTAALGKLVDTINPAGGPGGRQSFPIFTSTLMFIMRSPFTVTCPSCAPSLPHLAHYYTHGENKQFPYLIIHIIFIWYSVTMGNLVVE